MKNDYLDEFFEGVYNNEMELKHKLEGPDNLIIGVIGVLAGVAGVGKPQTKLRIAGVTA